MDMSPLRVKISCDGREFANSCDGREFANSLMDVSSLIAVMDVFSLWVKISCDGREFTKG